MTEPRPVIDDRPPRRLAPFLPTLQHRRFARGRRRGLTRTTILGPALERSTRQASMPASLLASWIVMITPTVAITHRGLDELLYHRCSLLGDDIEQSFYP